LKRASPLWKPDDRARASHRRLCAAGGYCIPCPVENPNMTRPEAERLAVLETKMDANEKHLASMDAKLDDLLALRHKGIGAFWLAATLTGTGIIGGMSLLWDWLSK
jgi:hypothetical protein